MRSNYVGGSSLKTSNLSHGAQERSQIIVDVADRGNAQNAPLQKKSSFVTTVHIPPQEYILNEKKVARRDVSPNRSNVADNSNNKQLVKRNSLELVLAQKPPIFSATINARLPSDAIPEEEVEKPSVQTLKPRESRTRGKMAQPSSTPEMRREGSFSDSRLSTRTSSPHRSNTWVKAMAKSFDRKEAPIMRRSSSRDSLDSRISSSKLRRRSSAGRSEEMLSHKTGESTSVTSDGKSIGLLVSKIPLLSAYHGPESNEVEEPPAGYVQENTKSLIQRYSPQLPNALGRIRNFFRGQNTDVSQMVKDYEKLTAKSDKKKRNPSPQRPKSPEAKSRPHFYLGDDEPDN